MVAHLEAGDAVSLFPEGTRTRDGRVQPFRKGALLAARMAGVPIVPAGIRGGYEAWPRTASRPRMARVAVRFGAPIDSSAPDALERVQAAIESMVGDGRFASIPPSS
jgi:1-acyl-sn-glycerol-3-phosphate acyltransferase